MHLGIQLYQQASNPSNDLFGVIEEQKFQLGKLTKTNFYLFYKKKILGVFLPKIFSLLYLND
jgi:hypothetical protein